MKTSVGLVSIFEHTRLGPHMGLFFFQFIPGRYCVLGTLLKTFILIWSGPRSILAPSMAGTKYKPDIGMGMR